MARHGEAQAATLARLQRGVPMEFAAHDYTVWDPHLPVCYLHTPRHPDSLTRLPCIDASMQAELNFHGIHTFLQLAFMNDQHFANLRELNPGVAGLPKTVGRWRVACISHLDSLRTGRRGLGDLWRWRAWRVDQGERLHAKFGAIFKVALSQVYDLKRLDGVDLDIAAQLNGIGIYQFAQLMQMTLDQFAALRDHDHRLRGLEGGGHSETSQLADRSIR